jgi:hypothetical protein
MIQSESAEEIMAAVDIDAAIVEIKAKTRLPVGVKSFDDASCLFVSQSETVISALDRFEKMALDVGESVVFREKE